MTPIEILTSARALIRDRSTWIAGHLAIDHTGHAIAPTASAAVAFCALGAIERAARDVPDAEAVAALALALGFTEDDEDQPCAEEERMRDYIANTNDAEGEGHAAILAAFDNAIMRLRAEADLAASVGG